jgi:hypothetical protein
MPPGSQGTVATAESVAMTGGFASGMHPESIVGVQVVNEELIFLVKWAGSLTVEAITELDAKTRCANLVMFFYEKLLKLRPL